MAPIQIRKSPLSVLIVLQDSEFFGSSMLSALRKHYTLICRSSRQALESAPGFAPTVVIVDLLLNDWEKIVNGVSLNPGTVLVALAPPDSASALPPEFKYRLASPATEQDFEQLMSQIGQEAEVDDPVMRTA